MKKQSFYDERLASTAGKIALVLLQGSFRVVSNNDSSSPVLSPCSRTSSSWMSRARRSTRRRR